MPPVYYNVPSCLVHVLKKRAILFTRTSLYKRRNIEILSPPKSVRNFRLNIVHLNI